MTRDSAFERIDGLHHVTAISGGAQRNLDFHSGGLGLRFVKRTVNFDDPGTYHLYYGNETGEPGTVMTFFPWENARRGTIGAGQVSVTQYSVPNGALGFWAARLPEHGARLMAEESVFGQRRAVFGDPDGLVIALVESGDPRAPWTTPDVGAEVAIRGFHGVTLALHDGAGAERILGKVFGYEKADEETREGGQLVRWCAPGKAGIVDLHIDPTLPPGVEGTGTVHHVAFRVPDTEVQMAVRDRMLAAGLQVTRQIDRDYFKSIYARIPGGILFEVATNEPGFAVDEPVGSLGTALKLPKQHEPMRASIEAGLPALMV